MGLSLDTWVEISAVLGVGISATTLMRSSLKQMRGDLKADISRLDTKIDLVRTELKDDMSQLRTELKDDIRHLDDRVYQLATGLGPLVAQAQETARSS